MISIHDIQTLVAQRMGTTMCDLLSARQDQASARPRHVAMWLCRHCTGYSLPAIGRAFDRDHTTVLNAIRRVDARLLTDTAFAREVRALRAMLDATNGRIAA